MHNALAANKYDGCKFELTDSKGMTAEYNLEYFQLDYDVFTVVDSEGGQFRQFTYMFDICRSINSNLWSKNTSIPQECKHPAKDPADNYAPCIKSHVDETDGVSIICDQYEDTTGEIPSAIQIDKNFHNETKCYWLGMEVASTDNLEEYTMELLDPDDAGKGVVFTILNGQWCAPTYGFPGRNRELRVKLECPDDARIEFEPDSHTTQFKNSVVEEVDTCIYEVSIVSPNACPNRCVSRMNLEMYAVCATHGICEADPYGNGDDLYPNGTLRCLCDDGYKGEICEEQDTKIKIIDENHPGLLAAIVICIVLLGVAIVCSAVLCHKIRIEEMERTSGLDQRGLGDGMLNDPNDAALTQQKTDAMTMDIGMGDHDGNQLTTATGTRSNVQLQTMDDQMETDKNELLDKTDDESDNDDDAAPEEEEEETNPGAEE